MVECANIGNITGFVIDWEPPAHKDKWSTSKMEAAAVDFAQYSNELATALHASGRRLGLDLSGDQGSPIDQFKAFGTHATSVDFFTMMATYHYFDSVEKDRETHYVRRHNRRHRN